MPVLVRQGGEDLLAALARKPPSKRIAKQRVRTLRLSRPVHRRPVRGVGNVANGGFVPAHRLTSTPEARGEGAIRLARARGYVRSRRSPGRPRAGRSTADARSEEHTSGLQ